MQTVNVKSLGNCPYLVSLEPQDIIGEGSYARVCRAYNKLDHRQCLATKIFNLAEVGRLASALRELAVTVDLRKHPNLVEYKKTKITSKNRLYIVMEECRSSLHQLVRDKKQPWPQEQVWQLLGQVSEGYKVLEQKGIIHRDLKPENILVGFDGKYKLSDFGLADIVSTMGAHSLVKGSLLYLAPQLFVNAPASKIIDVYSLGVTVYWVCFRRFPYLNNADMPATVTDFTAQVSSNELKFPKNHNYSQKLVGLLASMLERDPQRRCTWEYIYYVLMVKSPPANLPYSQNTPQIGAKQFRIVEISDALMKNLSKHDTELYSCLENESVAIIDHIEAQIIAQRQIVFYCDRLQYRLQIITAKTGNRKLRCFSQKLLGMTYCLSSRLDKHFEAYYQKMKRSEFMKLVASHKYSFIRSLIRQDCEALANEIADKMDPTTSQSVGLAPQTRLCADEDLNELEIQVYGQCYEIVVVLYTHGYYQECKQVDELEKWLESKEKSGSFLGKLRRNENAFKQFDHFILNTDRAKLRQIISPCYLHIFSQIDRKAPHP